jgi:hypothetical protein
MNLHSYFEDENQFGSGVDHGFCGRSHGMAWALDPREDYSEA